MSEEQCHAALNRLGEKFDLEFWLLENGHDRLYTRQEVITMLSTILGNIFFEFANKSRPYQKVS
jgi:hypothetical protein